MAEGGAEALQHSITANQGPWSTLVDTSVLVVT